MSSSSLRISVSSLLVAAGIVGWLALHARPPTPQHVARNDDTATWSLHDAGDDTPRYSRPPGSESDVLLQPGRMFRVTQGEYELQRYESLHFALNPEEPGTIIELSLRETPQAATVLELRPADPLIARALLRRDGERDLELARGRRGGRGAEPLDKFLIAVRFDGVKLSAALDGQPLVAWEAPGIDHGALVLRVREGAARVQRVGATGQQTTQLGAWREFSFNE